MDLINTFQITPYSDDVASYINSLTLEQIYAIFGLKRITADVLTAALLAVYKLNPNSPMSNRDELLFTSNLNNLAIYPQVFVLVQNGVYIQHLYAWTIKNRTDKRSITNIVGNLTGNLAPEFMIAIKQWINSFRGNISNSIRTNTKDKVSEKGIIRVLQPTQAVANIIKRCGFYQARSLRDDEQSRWLFESGSIGDTPLAKDLLFREYDYVAPVEAICN